MVLAAGGQTRFPALRRTATWSPPRMSRTELERIGHRLRRWRSCSSTPVRASRYGRRDYVTDGMRHGAGGDALSCSSAGVRVTGTDAWRWDAPFGYTAQSTRATRTPSIIWEGHRPAATSAIATREAPQPRIVTRQRVPDGVLPGERPSRLGRMDPCGGDLRRVAVSRDPPRREELGCPDPADGRHTAVGDEAFAVPATATGKPASGSGPCAHPGITRTRGPALGWACGRPGSRPVATGILLSANTIRSPTSTRTGWSTARRSG